MRRRRLRRRPLNWLCRSPAHGVHHAARPQEQQGLEERVREQVEHAGGNAHQRAGAQPKEHVAELADRRIGQDAL